MVEQMPTGTHGVFRNSRLMPILRAHAMGELQTLDIEILRSYHNTLLAKITDHTETLRSNIQRGYAAEIRADVRWFQTIYDEISTLLTGAFNARF